MKNKKKCLECKENLTYNDICGKCRYREKRFTKITSDCKECGEEVEFSISRKTYFEKRGGKLCDLCVKKRQIKFMTEMNATRTSEELAEFARKGHKKQTFETRSKATKKQWEKLRKNPKKMAERSQKHSNSMKKKWKEYSIDKKNRILKKWFTPFSRSKLNDDVRDKMIEGGFYEGFISEEPFCGFIPDEINHELKIIVEVYGDYWHCNPKIYKNPKQHLKRQDKTVEERWIYDRRRLGCFYGKGYIVIIVWESDFKKNKEKQIERIKNAVAKKRKIR